MPETVQIPCVCQGDNPGCVVCSGSGEVTRDACPRCHGSKVEAGTDKTCLDCRGRGYREQLADYDRTVTL